MSRTSPEDTFVEAQTAIEGRDWDGFFVCLDPDSLVRIAENSVARFLARDDAAAGGFARVCSEHAVPQEMIHQLHDLRRRMEKSARELASYAAGSDPKATLRESLKHKQIVDEYQKILRNAVKAVPDLPRFTAALEGSLRAAVGGGSVSSRLFVGEALENVSIEGAKAWATRRFPGGQSEDIGFARRKGLWYIRLFSKRPRRRLG